MMSARGGRRRCERGRGSEKQREREILCGSLSYLVFEGKSCRSHHLALLVLLVLVVEMMLRSIMRGSSNRVVIEKLEDQEQELVRKKRDRRPYCNRSNHRHREHDILDGLGSVCMSLDAPSNNFDGIPIYAHTHTHIKWRMIGKADQDPTHSIE